MPIYRNHANLISLYLFENISSLGVDSVGANSLTNTNSTPAGTAYLAKQGFYAADFELGSSQRLSITDASQTGLDITGSITICAWVRFESLAVGTDEGLSVCGKYTVSGNQRGYWLWARNTGSNYRLRANISNDGTAITTIEGGTNLSTGIWYHVVLVYNGTDLRLYLNGEADATPVSYSSGIFNNTGRFEIGNRGDGGASYFMDGLIDEVAIFNAALSEADINEIMLHGILPVAKTYYVAADGSDSDNGTSPATPWQTTARIRTAFNNGELNPGDRVLLRRGDSFAVNASSRQIDLRNCIGTLLYPITIGAYGVGARPYLNDSTGGDRECFNQQSPPSTGWDTRACHVVIQDVAMSEFDAATQSNEVVRLTGSHHIQVQRCYLNNNQTSNVATYTIVGIQAGKDTHHIVLRNNVIKDCGGEALYFSRAADTIPTFDMHIAWAIANTMIDCDGEGIDLKGNSDYVHILRNFIEGCGSYGTSQLKVGGRYHRLFRNHISRQRGSCTAGIELEYTADTSSFGCMFSIAERNFVSDMTGTSGGIEVNGSANAARNNTIVNCDRGLYINEQGWDAAAQRIYNNLLANNTWDLYRNGGSNFLIDYNGYSDGPTGIWNWGGSSRNLSYVQGTLGFEAHALTSGADVENTGLYVLKSTSPYIDQGYLSTAYNYNGSALDIGWFEYNWRNFAAYENLFDSLTGLTSSGAVSATETAKHRDTKGLLATVSTTPANVSVSPLSCDRGFFRFYVNLDNVTASTGDKFKIFQINNGTPAEAAALEVRKFSGEWRVRASITGDSGTAQVTPWAALVSGWNCLELWWLREYEDAQAWGEVALYINAGSAMLPTAEISEVNNDTRGNCASISLGTIGTIPGTCSGSLYLAALTVNQWEYIGPHGPVRENDPDLVALWKFDNSAALGTDSGPNANTLNQSSVAFTGNAFLSIGAVDFEAGSLAFMSINHPNQTGLDLQPPFSLMFYVKFESDGGTDGIVSKEQAGGGNLAYELRRLSDGRLRLTLSTDGTTTTTFESDNALYSQVWYHLVVVVNNTDVRFYVDGMLDSESPGAWSAALNLSDGTFRIGRAGNDYMDSLLDDFAIYRRALSADEVWWSYKNSVWGTGSFTSAGGIAARLVLTHGPTMIMAGG